MWQCINTDYVTLRAGMTDARFFDTRPPGHEEVLRESENLIVRKIRNEERFFPMFLQECGIVYPRFVFLELPRSVLDARRNQGDFDMVVASRDETPKLCVLEFKRIKITATGQGNDRLNKVSGISELYNQLEDRLRLGFALVYGVLIFHADLGLRSSPNTFLRGYSDETNVRLSDALQQHAHALPDEAGLALVRLDYPTSEMRRNNICTKRLKYPIERYQSGSLGSRFMDFLSSNKTHEFV